MNKSVTSPHRYTKIDHIAIAVRNLEPVVTFFTGILGFTLVRRLKVTGARTGMISAELEHNGIKFVLLQGTEPESQVSRLIDHYGPGVAHIALAVDDVDLAVRDLAAKGLTFDTTVIAGAGLRQVFSTREPNSGLSFEFIQRTSEQGFLEDDFLEGNVKQLFEQLEKADLY